MTEEGGGPVGPLHDPDSSSVPAPRWGGGGDGGTIAFSTSALERKRTEVGEGG